MSFVTTESAVELDVSPVVVQLPTIEDAGQISTNPVDCARPLIDQII